jgi:hypothetical protein
VVRFWNTDVLSNIQGVLRRILEIADSPLTLPLPPPGGEEMTRGPLLPLQAGEGRGEGLTEPGGGGPRKPPGSRRSRSRP